MGNKQSSRASWTFDDWAFGPEQRHCRFGNLMGGAKNVPKQYFGGSTIEQDSSILKIQYDLLAIDNAVKRLAYRITKGKQAAKELADRQSLNNFDEEIFHHNQTKYYYQRQSKTIMEEDEDEFSSQKSVGRNSSKHRISNNEPFSWRCSYCNTENRLSEMDCRHCKEKQTRF